MRKSSWDTVKQSSNGPPLASGENPGGLTRLSWEDNLSQDSDTDWQPQQETACGWLCVWERNPKPPKPHGHTWGYPFLWLRQERVNPGQLLAWPSWNKSARGSLRRSRRGSWIQGHKLTHTHPRVYFLPRKSLGSHSGSGNAPGFESLAGQGWLWLHWSKADKRHACNPCGWPAGRQQGSLRAPGLQHLSKNNPSRLSRSTHQPTSHGKNKISLFRHIERGEFWVSLFETK